MPEADLTQPNPKPRSTLPIVRAALAVCAHPDDESFGLGAILTALVDAGTPTASLCFTHGEASTLNDGETDLRNARASELAEAAEVLGLIRADLLDYVDSHLDRAPVEELAGHVVRAARRLGASVLVAFDEGGITGHPDHRQATRAAIWAAEQMNVGVLGWAVAEPVALTLNRELGTNFAGRPAGALDFVIPVDRRRQQLAIACHRSQSALNPVLRRRLALTGPTEPMRWLRPPPDHPSTPR